MELWVGALNLGLMYGFLAVGAFLTYKVLGFSDITVDETFTLGAAVAAALLVAGCPPLWACAAAFGAGALGGAVTGLFHTRFQINGLLAGILVMTGLYSVNLHVMGKANIPLLGQASFFSYGARVLPGWHPELSTLALLVCVMVAFWILVTLAFRTDLGLSLRAAGENPIMAGAGGVNVARYRLLGIALANGLAGLSGALVAQYQGFADVGMGVGTVVMGMASVILGESLLRSRSMGLRIMAVLLGAVLFRLLVAFALAAGMNPIDLKLLTAAFVLVTLVASGRMSAWRLRVSPRAMALGAGLLVLAGGGLFLGLKKPWRKAPAMARIGILEFVENGLTSVTRENFLQQMQRLGYRDGQTCQFIHRNAQGDTASLSNILDSMARDQVDIVLSITTPATQAALGKLHDRPLVFATVANPFLLKAGTSETDHRPNVTGVYGSVPPDQLLDAFSLLYPGATRIGCIYDPGAANSVYNYGRMKQALQSRPRLHLETATISSSSEVYQAAKSLTRKGVQGFVLFIDNLVFSAMDGVVKAADEARIPVITSDLETLKRGALVCLGYDYAIGGMQASRLVDRILKGGKPKDIPFEPLQGLMIRLNPQKAQELGITFPEALVQKAQRSQKAVEDLKADWIRATAKEPPRLAVFYFAETVLFDEAIQGLRDELAADGFQKRTGLQLEIKCAQGDFGHANGIAQDLVRSHPDAVVSFSTPTLQALGRHNQSIPHVFGAVTDPVRAGVIQAFDRHPPNMTGLATFQPVESELRTMRESFPGARRIGLVWNPSELNSELCRNLAVEKAPQYGFQIVETTVGSTTEVKQAVESVLAKGVDLFLTTGDTTVATVVTEVAGLLKQKRVPYFTSMTGDTDKGSLAGIGADYYLVGRETGRVVKRVLQGESPAGIPVRSFAPDMLAVNLDTAKALGITLPATVLKRAAKKVGTGR